MNKWLLELQKVIIILLPVLILVIVCCCFATCCVCYQYKQSSNKHQESEQNEMQRVTSIGDINDTNKSNDKKFVTPQYDAFSTPDSVIKPIKYKIVLSKENNMVYYIFIDKKKRIFT